MQYVYSCTEMVGSITLLIWGSTTLISPLSCLPTCRCSPPSVWRDIRHKIKRLPLWELGSYIHVTNSFFFRLIQAQCGGLRGPIRSLDRFWQHVPLIEQLLSGKSKVLFVHNGPFRKLSRAMLVTSFGGQIMGKKR